MQSLAVTVTEAVPKTSETATKFGLQRAFHTVWAVNFRLFGD
jgi:hypothetical protein